MADWIYLILVVMAVQTIGAFLLCKSPLVGVGPTSWH